MIVAREKTSSYGFFEETLQPKKTRRRKNVFKVEKLIITGFILAVFLLGLFVTNHRAQLFTLGHRIDRINKEMALLRVENQGLEEQIQQLIDLDNIEYVAINKLYMVRPEVNDYILVTAAGTDSKAAGEQARKEPVTFTGEEEKNPLIKTLDQLVHRFDRRAD